MAFAFITTAQIKVFDQSIFGIVTDLKNKYNRAGHTGIPGLWTLDSGLWTLDAGLWTLDSEHWTLDPGCYT